MNKNLSKVLLTSASVAALLAAYPSVAQNANEAGFDLPEVTAQAATSRTAFIRAARALPSVSNITADDAVDVQAARALYNGLSAADKADADVDRWEGYLTQKEAALPVDAASFIRAARALPAVADITEADRADIAAVRDLYNDLSAADRNRDDVQRWRGYVQQKLAALPSDAGAQFIVESRALPNLSEIAGMDADEFAAAKVDIQAARSTYRQLNAEQRADEDVSRWAGYLSQKEDAFGITFQLSARALPTLAEIADMDEAELVATQANAASTRALYNALSDVAQADDAVARWEGFLTQKEDAIEAALAGEEPEEPEEPELTLEEVKEAAIEELNNYVDADDYTQRADALTSAIEDGTTNINEASSARRVQTALADAKVAINEIPTDAELNNAELARVKAAAQTTVDTYAEENRDNYSGADLAAFDAIIADVKANIGNATTVRRVETLLIDAAAAVEELSADPTPAEELQAVKAAAVEELENYVDADNYTENSQALTDAIDDGRVRINDESVTTSDRVATILEDAKARIDEIATDAEVLANQKAVYVEDLENYVDADDYTTNREALNAAIAEGTEAINAAENAYRALVARDEAYAVIDEINNDLDVAVAAGQEALSEYVSSANAYTAAGGKVSDEVYQDAYSAKVALENEMVVGGPAWVEEDILEATETLYAALADLDAATAQLEANAEAAEALAEATTAVVAAEEFEEGLNENSTPGDLLNAQIAHDEAKALVDALPNGSEKSRLQLRLSNVQITINDFSS